MEDREDAIRCLDRPGPEVIKPFSCSAHLRLKFILLTNVIMSTIVEQDELLDIEFSH